MAIKLSLLLYVAVTNFYLTSRTLSADALFTFVLQRIDVFGCYCCQFVYSARERRVFTTNQRDVFTTMSSLNRDEPATLIFKTFGNKKNGNLINNMMTTREKDGGTSRIAHNEAKTKSGWRKRNIIAPTELFYLLNNSAAIILRQSSVAFQVGSKMFLQLRCFGELCFRGLVFRRVKPRRIKLDRLAFFGGNVRRQSNHRIR
jgi:hypothetical protein